MNWNWCINMFSTRMMEVVPALLATTRQMLPLIRDINTLNVYTFADAMLHGNTIAQDLAINDPADANAILAASRAACHFIGMTLTFNPRQATPQGTLITANELPQSSMIRVYIRAPLNNAVAGGGLLNAITKDLLVNNTANVFRLGVQITVMAVKQGGLPFKDVFDHWLDERCNEVYFSGMKQVAKKMYIGTEVATDTLKQRFHGLSQRKYDPVTRKVEFLTVSEFHQEMVALLNEVSEMDAATIQQQVPELDSLFYHGLIARLKSRCNLAQLTQHAASQNLGENMAALQTMVDAAKATEHKVNQIVSISMAINTGAIQ